jgi:DNA-directed RNA polymerase subunit RPC12/RpoP
MSIRVICELCLRELKVQERLAGRRGKCPFCGYKINVPAKPAVPNDSDDVLDALPVDDLPSVEEDTPPPSRPRAKPPRDEPR